MGTRTGDIDPGALLYIADKEKTSIHYTNTLINKFSGMLGVTGISSDMRNIEKAAEQGNYRAEVALDMYAYRVKKYIGSYAAGLGGVDILIFTGGIGENDTLIRRKVLSEMEFLGIKVDPDKMDIRGKEAIISTENSKVKVMVIPTDEELVIAQDTYQIVTQA